MQNNISPYISSGIPEFIRGANPLFRDFIDTYYKYVEQRTKAVGSIHNRYKDTDIDETLDVYVSEFYSTYGQYLPKDIALDKRNFIKLLSLIYDAKGTKKAFELIFKSVFNETVRISYPSEQILRASDGTWVVDKFISVLTKFGELPTSGVIIKFSNSRGDFTLDISKVVNVDYNINRLFFNTYSEIFVDINQLVRVFSSSGDLLYVGQVVKSPATLTVVIPGNSWQVGQVITVPGKNNSHSIARVTKITPSTGIAKLEILEYGTHDENEIITVSPYKNRPSSSDILVETTLVSVSPNVYHHEITIADSTDGIDESIVGVSDTMEDSYYLTEYMVRGYYGSELVNRVFSQSYPKVVNQDTGITQQEWLNSRATLIYSFGNLVTSKGKFSNENGQLSNQFIRLEDNYYYQPFSYVIETSRDIEEYKNILNIVHPAGTKRFSTLEKTATYLVDVSTTRTLSYEVIGQTDIVNSSDLIQLDASKTLGDDLGTLDSAAYVLNKYIQDSVGASSLDYASATSVGYFEVGVVSGPYIGSDHELTIG